MNLLVDFPSIVKKYSVAFESCFSSAGFEHFKRFLSGLIISENKTVTGINRLFVLQPKNQSSLNEFLKCQNFDLELLNKKRLNLMQSCEATRFKAYKKGGVISIDNSLLSHYGKHFDGIYKLYDYVDNRYVMAHDLVTLQYSDELTDYPVYYQLWTPPDWEAVALHMKANKIHVNETKWQNRHKELKKWYSYMRDRYRDYQYKLSSLQEVYQTKNHIGIALLRQFQNNYPDYNFPVAMDSGFTTAQSCKIISKELKMSYVGCLKSDAVLILKGSEQKKLNEFAEQLKKEHLKAQQQAFQNTKPIFQKTSVYFKGQKLTYYAYCKTHRLKNFGKQRLVISYRKKDLTDTPLYTISNCRSWHASGILRIRRHRWPIETYHQEGKSEGLAAYQVRNFKAIHAHIAFVVVAYSMLRHAQHDKALLSSIQHRLHVETMGTLPFLRRLMKAEAMANFIQYIIDTPQLEAQIMETMQPFFANIAYH